MVDVSPFQAWRYDLGQVGDLSEVIAPPYDVLSPEQQAALYERHPHNVVRLILNRSEAGDTAPSDRAARAAACWKHWRLDRVLRQDHENALYVYHQTFEVEGRTWTRRGFLGRLLLSEFGAGKVFPHEQTLAGPKADQLELMRQCHAQLSPIFGLYPDPQQAVQARLDDACQSLTATIAIDDQRVTHRLWVVQDPAVIGDVQRLLRDRPLFIADGHHRYETALAYRNERREQGLAPGPLAAVNFALMMFVGTSDNGLRVLPTHRVFSGMPSLSVASLEQALEPWFQTERIGQGDAAAERAWQTIELEGSQDVLALVGSDGEWLVARLADPDVMAEVAGEHSAQWRDLGVAILHRVVLDKALAQMGIAQATTEYVHRWQEVASAVPSRAQLGCLVPAIDVEQVCAIAAGNETMPPKSTYFYPKLGSGLVFHDLRD